MFFSISILFVPCHLFNFRTPGKLWGRSVVLVKKEDRLMLKRTGRRKEKERPVVGVEGPAGGAEESAGAVKVRKLNKKQFKLQTPTLPNDFLTYVSC